MTTGPEAVATILFVPKKFVKPSFGAEPSKPDSICCWNDCPPI